MGAQDHRRRCRPCRNCEDVNSDQQDKGLEVDLKIDRATASRLGLTASQIDNTLYDAFGQRQVSTIYKDKNQYHVVMEVAPEFWQSPETCATSMSRPRATSPAPRPARAPAALSQRSTTTSSTTGTNSAPTRPTQAAEAVRNQQLNAHHHDRPRWRLDRRLGLDPGREDGAAVGLCQLRPRHHAAFGQPSGSVRRHDLLLQPAAGRDRRPGLARHQPHHGQHQCADLGPWRSGRHPAAGPAVACQPAASVPGRDPDDLYRAGHSL